MNKAVAWCLLICFTAIMLALVICYPTAISDHNEFLHHFVNQELLALLGIIMTITLASAANLHLEFNKIEERHKKRALTGTRAKVKQAANCLIVLFTVSVAIVVCKPLMDETERLQAVFNGAALFVVLWNVMILVELTQLTFAIKPEIDLN
jgi:hypothetical protein